LNLANICIDGIPLESKAPWWMGWLLSTGGGLEIAVSAMADYPSWLTGRSGKNSGSYYAGTIEKRLCEETRGYFSRNPGKLIITYAHIS